jgi:predicted TIM-barrel fold metal-dependent hydrolase
VTTTFESDLDTRERNPAPGLIDADVHNYFESREEIDRYLPRIWHGRPLCGGGNWGVSGLLSGISPRTTNNRLDSVPPSGKGPATDVAFLAEQLLDGYGIAKAILHPINDVLKFAQSGNLGRALARAVNLWQEDKWFAGDDRLYAGITVPVEDPVGAVQEIEQWASHPRFVNVTLTAITREPLGDAKYRPIFEAAVAHGLPVAIHAGGWSGTLAGPGFPTWWTQVHTYHYMSHPTQLCSLVASGLFQELPTLRVALEEGGLAWVPPLMWRLDRAWEEMREDAPQLEEPPSATIRRHLWFTTQPIDQPDNPQYLGWVLGQMDMDDRIMYSSDYPHWDFDDPARVLLKSEVGAERRAKILSQNALGLFAFDRAR